MGNNKSSNKPQSNIFVSQKSIVQAKVAVVEPVYHTSVSAEDELEIENWDEYQRMLHNFDIDEDDIESLDKLKESNKELYEIILKYIKSI
eukprot:CAMPEP_0201576018 /NCGR_PEP_ID=MMETSP0190_2-20130828/21571_1 /ASSEMBLY_ACC=CAM_ASM_000263 /TAXON_ID=37353 /ORGANISM="Rosalina sp." /LENGTH=89 /DNA_ID=CAMNT_0048006379 /DNA_START=19 /DNA_END=289 /DNA_ORIENTATION=+